MMINKQKKKLRLKQTELHANHKKQRIPLKVKRRRYQKKKTNNRAISQSKDNITIANVKLGHAIKANARAVLGELSVKMDVNVFQKLALAITHLIIGIWRAFKLYKKVKILQRIKMIQRLQIKTIKFLKIIQNHNLYNLIYQTFSLKINK